MPTGALPLEGTTETLDMLLGTDLPYNPSVQLQASGNHRESTNHLPKDQKKRKIAQGNDAVEQWIFSWNFPATCNGRQQCCFFPTTKQIVYGVCGGWHLSHYLRAGAAMVTVVFLMETMTQPTLSPLEGKMENHPCQCKPKASQRILGMLQREDRPTQVLQVPPPPFEHAMILLWQEWNYSLMCLCVDLKLLSCLKHYYIATKGKQFRSFSMTATILTYLLEISLHQCCHLVLGTEDNWLLTPSIFLGEITLSSVFVVHVCCV